MTWMLPVDGGRTGSAGLGVGSGFGSSRVGSSVSGRGSRAGRTGSSVSVSGWRKPGPGILLGSSVSRVSLVSLVSLVSEVSVETTSVSVRSKAATSSR